MKDGYLFFYSVNNNRTMTKNIDVHRFMAQKFSQDPRFCRGQGTEIKKKGGGLKKRHLICKLIRK